MNLDAYLRAHGYVNVERPPELWDADVEEDSIVHLTGEMLAFALRGGNRLADLVLNVSNTVVSPDASDARMPAGEFVAVTIKGPGRWGSDATWCPGDESQFEPFLELDPALRASGVRFAYLRDLGGDGGSLTIYVPRERS